MYIRYQRYKKEMRKYFCTVLFVMAATVSFAQQNAGVKNDVLLLREASYDFGKIPQGKPVSHSFEMVNTGKEALHIENIHAACGCTTPEWSKAPIPAGGSTIVKVGYNAAAFGKFEKPVTIVYAGGRTKQFYVKGEVWQAPADIAPANASIQLLKSTNR